MGKNIRYYLMDNIAAGRVKCTIANWTGIAYRIPRALLTECHDRADLKQCGVYFLFGEDELRNERYVYVGQARIRKNGEGTYRRINEHDTEDYWNTAVAFITADDSFGPTDISYLDNRFWETGSGSVYVKSKGKLIPGKWNNVTVVYDQKSFSVNLNGNNGVFRKVAGQQMYPKAGIIGGGEDLKSCFTGKIKDLSINVY